MFAALKRFVTQDHIPRIDPYFATDIRKDWEKIKRFSPDIQELQRREGCNIFVYNELQEGQAAHHLLGEDKFKLAPAFTNEEYTVYQHRHAAVEGGRAFPIALKPEKTHSKMDFGEIGAVAFGYPARILGQMWTVRPRRMIEIDKYMMNTIYFDRRRVQLLVPFREWVPDRRSMLTERQIQRVTAWMYVGRTSFWDPNITSYHYQVAPLMRQHHDKEVAGERYYYFNDKVKVKGS